MHNAAKTSRFLIDLSSERGSADTDREDSQRGLLRQILASGPIRAADSLQVLNKLAQILIRLAEHAFSLRDASSLHEVSLVLINLPIAEARHIGWYYQALAIRRSGKIDESLRLLERLTDSGPLAYRARALQTLGAIYHRKGQPSEALRFYPEATQAASRENGSDLLTTLLVNQEIACIKSEKGDHRGALADYENLWPLVRIVSRDNPLYFYFYHNELAVEFAELGRIPEAKAASAIALASPFAHAYPEWSATRDEITAKRTSATPSIVAFSRPVEPEPSPQLEPQRQVQIEPQRRLQRSIKLSFDYSANNRNFFQRSVYSIPAIATGVLTAMSILERVLISIGPRAPPSLF